MTVPLGVMIWRYEFVCEHVATCVAGGDARPPIANVEEIIKNSNRFASIPVVA